MKNVVQLASIAILILFAQIGEAESVLCRIVHRNSIPHTEVSTGVKRISVPALIKQFDRLSLALKGTDNFISPRAWRKNSASFGLPALDLPQEVGGQGFNASKMIRIFEHAGKYALDLRDVVGGAHARPLANSNHPYMRAIVEKVAQGKAYMSVSITEEQAGSNMRAMKSLAEKTDQGYLLTGQKMYNARFASATHVIIFTKAEADPNSSKLNAFVLPIDYPGLKFSELKAHGLLANSFGGVSFDRLFVPEHFRLGNHGEGGQAFREHFLYWRLMMASAAIGTGKGALEQAVKRMRERQAFGGPIGRFTHLQQALAEHTAKLHMATLLVEQAAKLLDQQKYKEAAALVAMAKAEGVEWALKAADFVMEMFGAEGYTDRTDLAQRVADLQGLRIADGTTHVMRQEVVRRFYGEDFWNLAIGNPE